MSGLAIADAIVARDMTTSVGAAVTVPGDTPGHGAVVTKSKAKTPQAAVPQGTVDQLLRFFPTESVVIYTAVLSRYDPLKPDPGKTYADLSYNSRLVLFLVGIGITVLITFSAVVAKRLKTQTPRARGRVAGALPYVLAVLSFSAWALAQSNTALLYWIWGGFASDTYSYIIWVGAFAVGIGVSLAAQAFGYAPSFGAAQLKNP